MTMINCHYILLLCTIIPHEIFGAGEDVVFDSSTNFWSFDLFYEHPSIPGYWTTPDNQNNFDGLVTTHAQDVTLVGGVANNSISIPGTTTVLLGDVSGACLGDPEKCNTGFSVAMWIHINSNQASACVLLTTGADTGQSRGLYIKYLGDASSLLKFYVHNGTHHWSHEADISSYHTSDFWNHIGLVWNTTIADASLTVFINGQEIATASDGIGDVIGGNVDNTVYLNGNTAAGENCNAQYDELAIWEVGLDEFDIYSVYQDGYLQLHEPTTVPSLLSTGQASTIIVEVSNHGVMSSLEQIYIELDSDTITPSGVTSNTEVLVDLTTSNHNMTSEELALTLDILDKISGLRSYTDMLPTIEEKTTIRNSFVKTINQLVDPSKSGAWNALVENNSDVSFRLMHTVDSFADTILIDQEFQPFEITEDNIEMLGVIGSAGDDIYIKLNRGEDLVVIPSSAFAPGTVHNKVVTTVVFGLPKLVNHARRESNQSTSRINSAIINIDISQVAEGTFQDDVKMFFKMENDTYSRPQCVFLDGKNWSTEGCKVADFTGLVTECQCNHLTNFAVLMSVNTVELTETDRLALKIITYVGCCISLICLILALLLLLFLRELSSSRITILKNLIVALLVAELLFVTGIRATDDDMLCSIIAIFLHYFYLSVFSWMLVQGIQLLIKIRKVFDSNIRVLHFCLLGWGFPALVVCVTLAIDHHGYGTASNCWLSTERYTIWAFVGPAAVVILVNTVVLIMVLRVFMSVKSNKDKTEVQRFRSGLRATALLLPLLGLTWAFGLLAIDESTVAFQYIFASLNSLQGLFIFIFHCVMNDEVKSALNMRHQKLVSQPEGESSFFTKIMRTGRTAVRPDESSSVTHSTRATASATAM
ncbi:adhesion G protein-coupled receptor L4-like [Ptychodera flava]|uniref:adhesion G protein-coupled receptor L4-like n=1 Tax=Ptychodera flava TaxID=63121 RepID=UPI003969F975